MLTGPEQEKVPNEFVKALLHYGDLSLVKPLDHTKALREQNLSERGMYLAMYMCTFE